MTETIGTDTANPTTRYANAPIMEAILEVSVLRTEPISLEELSNVIEIGEDYSERIALMVASGQMSVGKQVSASASSHQIGYQFVSKDKMRVVHCKTDGLAFSRLPPYTEWSQVFKEFKLHWACYVKNVMPDTVTQVAVRYINRFDLPGPRAELNEYFRTYPEVSTDIRDDLIGFMNQLQIPQPDIKAHAIITQARVAPPTEGVISVLLDIAITMPLNVKATEDAILEPMKALRQRKNQLFEACIQPATRGLINQE